ncbi:MAG: hypothetical protein JW795_15250 [Chitinivibrionales bacterium]|nr:hypothetical protein [Chitinivibrionales bacterium]
MAPFKNQNLKLTLLKWVVPLCICCLVLLCTDTTTLVTIPEPIVLSSQVLIPFPQSMMQQNAKNQHPLIQAETLTPAQLPMSGIPTPADLYATLFEKTADINTYIHGKQQSISTMIDSYIKNLPWRSIELIQHFDTTTASITFSASYKAIDSLPYQVQIKDTLHAWRIDARFRCSTATCRGTIMVALHTPKNDAIDSAIIALNFDTSAVEKKMSVSVTQHHRSITPSRFQMPSCRISLLSRGPLLYTSACYYLPNLDSIIPNTKGHCLCYTAVSQRAEDLSVITVGVPLSTHPDTTALFTDYGLFSLLQVASIHYIIPALSDSAKKFLVTSCKQQLSIDSIVSLITNDTTFELMDDSLASSLVQSDITRFLQLNTTIESLELQQEFLPLLRLHQAQQPLYCTATGIIGNGINVPKGFESLSTTLFILQPYTPVSVRDLKITFP